MNPALPHLKLLCLTFPQYPRTPGFTFFQLIAFRYDFSRTVGKTMLSLNQLMPEGLEAYPNKLCESVAKKKGLSS
jgi:hypothetical protein